MAQVSHVLYVTLRKFPPVFHNIPYRAESLAVRFSLLLLGLSFLGLLTTYFLMGNPARILGSYTEKGSFYEILPILRRIDEP